jgi:MYXO-CTERM domain-containing protein
MRPRHIGGLVLTAAGLVAIPIDASAALNWTVVYKEKGTTTGFYDSSSRSSVGGNTGKTLGEQRRIAFEKAVSIWADTVTSTVPVTIEATMTALPCDANGAILGQASAKTVAPATNGTRELVYPIALANDLFGYDLEPASTLNPSGAEIVAEFNSSLGSASCLGGSGFYLGLDGAAGTQETDFLGVVLHELGHGFGFASFLDMTTAAPIIPGTPDAYSTHTFDLDRNATWDTLSQSQLLTSFKNARKVVWNGSHVTQAASRSLVKGSPRIAVSPAVSGLSGVLSEHDYGPKLSEVPATGPLVVPNPASGCSQPSNAGALNGAIALVDPKNACHPLEAVAYMQYCNAKAVIAVDSTAERPPAMIVGILEGQTIPVVSIHRDDAALLTAQAVGRTVTLDGDSTRLVGTDAQGRIYLNATDPVVEGSTISHWDQMARNQLLMEPSRTVDHIDVDLTREFMWDLGWKICGDGAVQGAEECDDGNIADNDGCNGNCKKGPAVATGGSGGTGGSGRGGAPSGGAANGGVSSGGAAKGGAPSGGTTSAPGGTSAKGGTTSVTGGTSAKGGATTVTGGSSAKGGTTSAPGGGSVTGGASNGGASNGGAATSNAKGGIPGTAPGGAGLVFPGAAGTVTVFSPNPGGGGDSGCGCRVPRSSKAPGTAVALLWIALLRLRRRSKRK